MPWRTLAAAAVLTLAGLPGAAAAQQSQGEAGEKPSTPQVDVSKLPLDMARVQRRLRETVEREQRDGPSLRYTINVFAETPPLLVFVPDGDLRFGPVPYSAPTHQEMMNFLTPQEFRSPIMDFSNLLRWLQNRSKNDSK